MATPIATFSDGSQLVFDKGKFDDWCVYIIDDGKRVPPRDFEYFKRLKELKEHHGDRIYTDFIEIYGKTNAQIIPNVLKKLLLYQQIIAMTL